MKRLLLINCMLLAFLAALLFFPAISIEGASLGLTTWFQQVVPTLFPTMILSSIIIQTEAFFLILPIISPLCCKLFSTSPIGSCALVIGWLCGYPMGAKTANELCAAHLISQEEASYLLCFVNQPSPMFLAGFLRYQVLGNSISLWKILFSVYGSAYIVSIVARLFWFHPQKSSKETYHQTAKKEPALLSVIEQSFSNSCSILLTIGIYMMLFSIASLLIQRILSLPALLTALFSGILEMTSGISQLALLPLEVKWTAILSTALSSFGSCCTALQARSVSNNILYSFSRYLGCKFMQAILTGGMLLFLIR